MLHVRKGNIWTTLSNSEEITHGLSHNAMNQSTYELLNIINWGDQTLELYPQVHECLWKYMLPLIILGEESWLARKRKIKNIYFISINTMQCKLNPDGRCIPNILFYISDDAKLINLNWILLHFKISNRKFERRSRCWKENSFKQFS